MASLGYFWWAAGYLRQGRHWIEDALERCPNRCDTTRLRALESAASIDSYLGDYAAAREHIDTALALARSLCDVRSVSQLMGMLVTTGYLEGDLEGCQALASELVAWCPAGHPANPFFAYHSLGMTAHEMGDHVAATAYLAEALDRATRAGDRSAAAAAIGGLALESLSQPDGWHRSASYAREALELAHEVGHPVTLAWCGHVAVSVAADRRRHVETARLLGAMESLKAGVRLRVSPTQHARYANVVEATRAALGEASFAAASAEGRAMMLDQFVGAARAALGSAAAVSSARRGPQPKSELSPREHEVLQLVAHGRSDREIAATLVISENTAKFHLKSILRKLSATTRAEAIAIAARRGGLLDRTYSNE